MATILMQVAILYMHGKYSLMHCVVISKLNAVKSDILYKILLVNFKMVF